MKRLNQFVAAVFVLTAVASGQYLPAAPPSGISRGLGIFYAANYAFGEAPGSTPGRVVTGNLATGSQTITLQQGIVTLPDGRTDMPYSVTAPILIGNGTNAETVTPTAVSGCYETAILSGSVGINCNVTASFSNLHGQGEIVQSGSYGLQEAINDAWSVGGGKVVIDQFWAGGYGSPLRGTNTIITAAVPYQSVAIEDDRSGFGQSWQPAQSLSTVLAAPTTLTSTTVGFGINGANTTGGTYTGTSTYYYCIAYVDVMGNEGPCSATFSAATAGTGATNQIGFSAPAASTGAVGYTAYISVASGSYNLTYQVPLTSTVCTLTKIETVTPACAVTNAIYGQTGSAAVVSALTVNTAPLHLLKTTASTTSAYIGTPGGRTAYAYAPTGNVSTMGLTSTQQPFTVAPAAATTVPEVIATIPVPIGALNNVGATLCIAGQATEASAGSTATVQNIEFLWDAAGSNTTGAPVIIGQEQLTATLVTSNADFWNFQGCFQAQVVGSSVTAGTVEDLDGRIISTYGAGVLGNAGTEVLSSVASLNLAGTGGNTQRVHVVWLHTTATDGAGVQVTGLRAWWQ